MKNTIDEAIYTTSPEIICRHYNPLLGIVITAISILGLWANSNVAYFDQHELAYQWNLLISSCLFCAGVTMICYRLFGDSAAPVEKKSRKRLYRSEYTFDTTETEKVRTALTSGDFSLLQTLPRCYQAGGQVVCYRTDSGSLIAAQMLTKQEPTGDIRIFHAGEYTF